jgi:hypothetical protein
MIKDPRLKAPSLIPRPWRLLDSWFHLAHRMAHGPFVDHDRGASEDHENANSLRPEAHTLRYCTSIRDNLPSSASVKEIRCSLWSIFVAEIVPFRTIRFVDGVHP